MKYFLTVLLLCASFLNLINGDTTSCLMKCTSDFSSASAADPSSICKAEKTYLNCFGSCGGDVSGLRQQLQKTVGSSCDFSGSATVSGSLFTVLGALLLTAYKAVNP